MFRFKTKTSISRGGYNYFDRYIFLYQDFFSITSKKHLLKIEDTFIKHKKSRSQSNSTTHNIYSSSILWTNKKSPTLGYLFLNSSTLKNVDTWQHLGTRALYLVATLPEKKNKQKNTPIKDVSPTNLKQFVTTH